MNNLEIPNTPGLNFRRQTVARRAKELATAANELEQAALFNSVPFEEAFCLAPEEVAKRYTAENARQIEWRRHACIKLLARQCSSEDICDILKMNHRTVAAIAAQEGQQIAVFSEAYAHTLAASAMSDIAFAHTKRDEAGYKDLHIGAGIKLTHATSLKMIGAGGTDESAATELEAENPALIKAREFLEARRQSRVQSESRVQSPESRVENSAEATPV